MSYLLDTNILSETRKPKPNRHVVDWLASTADQSLYISVLVLGEIRLGVERLRPRDVHRADALDEWLHGLEQAFASRVISITPEIADRWGRLNASGRLPVTDSLQAATALVHGWTFVTRNIKDVESTGAKLLNPFEDE